MKLALMIILVLFSGCTINTHEPEPFEPGEVVPTPAGCQQGVDC